jgi:hypothetical protein
MGPEHDLIPNFTQFPNKLMDYVIPLLRESEEKVLIYVLRCTYGYRDQDGKQKEQDYISYSQFMTGQMSREGKLLNFGAGVSRSKLAEALAFHQSTGLIERLDPSAGKRNAGRGSTGLYRLNRHCELVHFLNQCLQDTETARERLVHFLNQKRLLVQKVNQSQKKAKKDKASAKNGSESEPLKNGSESEPEMVHKVNLPYKDKETKEENTTIRPVPHTSAETTPHPTKKVPASQQPGELHPHTVTAILSMVIEPFHCLANPTKLNEQFWDAQIKLIQDIGVIDFQGCLNSVDAYYAATPKKCPINEQSARARMSFGIKYAIQEAQKTISGRRRYAN